MEQAKQSRGSKQRLYNPIAFNNYVRWFLGSSRVEIHPPAYEEEILEEPTLFDNLENEEYNKLVREGTQTDFAPVMNFVVI